MICSHCGLALTPPLYDIMLMPNFEWTRTFRLHAECLITLTSKMTVSELGKAASRVGWVQLVLPLECEQGGEHLVVRDKN